MVPAKEAVGTCRHAEMIELLRQVAELAAEEADAAARTRVRLPDVAFMRAAAVRGLLADLVRALDERVAMWKREDQQERMRIDFEG